MLSKTIDSVTFICMILIISVVLGTIKAPNPKPRGLPHMAQQGPMYQEYAILAAQEILIEGVISQG